jgi:two-component system, LytTR family, response regulator
MRVVIADDEAPAREFLRRLLTSHNDVEVVGEAEDGTEVIHLVATAQPDVLFLDIQMPGGNGLEVAAGLMKHRPAIVFCTAYEQHAIEAFELEAVDYLLKPVSRSRLAQALDRIRRIDPAQSVPKAHERLSRFLARRGGHLVVIPASKAAYFESVDGLTKIVTVTGEAYWIDSPLQVLEERLEAQRFFRVSRNALINLNEVAEVHPLPGGSAELLLRGGPRLEVSRRRYRSLLEVIEKS